jgi:hypothetical protein
MTPPIYETNALLTPVSAGFNLHGPTASPVVATVLKTPVAVSSTPICGGASCN